jgi:hypothetical protein
MKRPNLNLAVDILALILAVLVVVTGLVLEYMLPPGSGRLGTEGFGFAPGAMQRPILLLWGLTRHEWGNIHFWTAIGLMGALSLHLVLHWRWIVCMVKGKHREGSGIRVALGILGLVSLLALALAPFLSSTVRMPRGRVLEQRQQSTSVK